MQGTGFAQHSAWAVAALLVGIPLVGCGNSTSIIGGGAGSSGGGGGGGAGLAGAGGSTVWFTLPDASALVNLDSNAPPTSDTNCGSRTSSTSKEPVDVLLVLDRSGSMNESIADDCCCSNACSLKACADTANCTERWPALTSAVNTTVQSTTGINWGLKFFSTPPAAGKQQTDNCALGDGVDVPVGTPASTIQTMIAGITPGNNTPTAKAITAATAYLLAVKDPNKKVILLATDGQPNCANTGTETDVLGTVAAIQAALAEGFKAYVIGIGPSVGNLDNFAQAGGTDRYYPATSATELASALASITKAVSSCTFTIADPPTGGDAGNIAVYADGVLVANDPTNGWTLGTTAQTVQLQGATCDRVTSGQVKQVQVLFGCSTPPPILY